MRRLVATRADESVRDMVELTHPLIQRFAWKWKADFLVLSHDVSAIRPTHPNEFVADARSHYRILAFRELFNEYDRILSIDSDMIINKNCPNPFEVVPSTHIGTVFNDQGSRRTRLVQIMQEAQQRWGQIGWTKGYVNTGFLVASREHSPIFAPQNSEHWTGFGVDDVLLTYKIHQRKIPLHELPFQWNHMSMFSEPWNGGADKFKSYVIHYAGRANRSIDQMKADYKKIYG